MLKSNNHVHELESVFPGKSEMAGRMRALDWSQTDLPLPHEWSEELRMAVQLCLTSAWPTVILWGLNYTMLYNDAYIEILTDNKHPDFLGKAASECWVEIWAEYEPVFASIRANKNTLWAEDFPFFLNRTSFHQEAFISRSIAPVLNKDGNVSGIFIKAKETTEKVISARRLETLHTLSILTIEIRTIRQACEKLLEVLQHNRKDIPFAAIYIADNDESKIRLIASVGLTTKNIFPKSVSISINRHDLSTHSKYIDFNRPFTRSFNKHSLEIIPDIASLELPGGAWPEFTNEIAVLPIPAAKASSPAGIFVVGVSPRCPLDKAYRSFFDLVAGHIGTAITNAKFYEAQRLRAESIAALDQAKTRFFSNISHEFRTPLTLILSLLDDVFQSSSPVLQGIELTTVRRNTLRLLKLVNTLLDFSKIEAGHMKAHFEPTNIGKFTSELASNFRAAIEKAGLKFIVNCDNFSEIVSLDREMWEKIVLNLLSNAFKFTFAGEIEIKLLKTSQYLLELSVRDTGDGIPGHELPNLFKRFHRIEGSRGRSFEGSGIGLALVQDLVHILGGKIKVESNLCKGTTFYVCLDTRAKHLLTENCSKTPTKNPSLFDKSEAFITEALQWLPTKAGLNKEIVKTVLSDFKILIADDNADMREYLQGLLSKYWKVEVASDGQEALTLIHKTLDNPNYPPFNLVLTDVMMPIRDGLSLLRALKTNTSTHNIPVIILSARAGEESQIQGLQEGADDYLVKPFSSKELLTRIETQLKIASRHQLVLENALLRKEQEEAKKSHRAKDIFLATLSHELKTPLTSILCWVEALKNKVQPGEELAKPIFSIEKSALEQNQLVDKLLDVSCMLLDKIKLDLKQIDIVELIENTVISFQEESKNKQININFSSNQAQVWLLLDAIRIRQVFNNLINNAIKFTNPQGLIELILEVHQKDIWIYIKDNGIGINPEFLPNIFERFTQCSSDINNTKQGLGLGLSLVYNFIKLHGGSIQALSLGINQGTTFVINLPAQSVYE